MNRYWNCFAVALLALTVGISGDVSAQLLNPSFESPDASGGDVPGTDDWDTFNNVFTTATVGRTGTQSLKTFGPFVQGGGSGATQFLAAVPGETWNGEVWALNTSGDPIDDADFGVYKIEFLDVDFNLAAGGLFGVDIFESNAIDGATPQDEWTLLGVGTAPAPENTAWARAVIVKVDVDGAQGGSIFWDDAVLQRPGVDVPPVTLGGLTLYQNAPNPFNPVTHIRFELAQPVRAKLGVYDTAGRLIATLIDAELEAGPYSVSWDGRRADGGRAASGVYRYVLHTPTGQLARSMVLLK
jgi:hypothetical protein